MLIVLLFCARGLGVAAPRGLAAHWRRSVGGSVITGDSPEARAGRPTCRRAVISWMTCGRSLRSVRRRRRRAWSSGTRAALTGAIRRWTPSPRPRRVRRAMACAERPRGDDAFYRRHLNRQGVPIGPALSWAGALDWIGTSEAVNTGRPGRCPTSMGSRPAPQRRRPEDGTGAAPQRPGVEEPDTVVVAPGRRRFGRRLGRRGGAGGGEEHDSRCCGRACYSPPAASGPDFDVNTIPPGVGRRCRPELSVPGGRRSRRGFAVSWELGQTIYLRVFDAGPTRRDRGPGVTAEGAMHRSRCVRRPGDLLLLWSGFSTTPIC